MRAEWYSLAGLGLYPHWCKFGTKLVLENFHSNFLMIKSNRDSGIAQGWIAGSHAGMRTWVKNPIMAGSYCDYELLTFTLVQNKTTSFAMRRSIDNDPLMVLHANP